MEIRKVCSLKKLSLGGCRCDRVALSGNTPLGYKAGRFLCLKLMGWSQAFVVVVEAGGRLRASSSRGGRKVLERYTTTTRQRQPRSKQYPAQVKSDNEAVLAVEMGGAVRYMRCSSARGRIKARSWAG
jgi:hypothetical protein